uniref:Uncharacterized protein n=1 Tax=Chrysemys picta bellii TaxID=8478 RepID=A0A8C3I045_CHRPI
MSFAELLDHVGGMGRFQIIYAILLAIPVFMLASHNLLQNFTAATSEHRCQVHININNTPYTNLTGKLVAMDLLRVSIPMDSDQQPEKCHRFVTMQRQLLDSNATVTNLTELETEPCADGWVYDKSIFTSTIITEVRLSKTCCSAGNWLGKGYGNHVVLPQVSLDLVLLADGYHGNHHCLLAQLHCLLHLPFPDRNGLLGHYDECCGIDTHLHTGLHSGWGGLRHPQLALAAACGVFALFHQLHLLLVG